MEGDADVVVRLAFDRLKEAIERPSPNDAADIDEVQVLVEAMPEAFSDNFRGVLHSLVEANPSDLSSSQIMMQLKRLHRILDAEQALPKHLRPSARVGTEQLLETALIPVFDLSEQDKSRILDLCVQMRKIVFATAEFDEPHRVRLLNRIAAMEREVHKKKGLFDVILGGVVDVGETLGKFGKDIKPLTDRMSEVAGIARKATKQYDQIPAPEQPLALPKPSEDPAGDDSE